MPARHTPPEITWRGTVLGAAITVVFLSSNLYLGLKTGMTFSSSIPAAVISMSVLKLLGGNNILENNIVQTQASAAGTLCNVVLVIPGLLLIHYWTDVQLVPTVALCLIGGLFGVAFSVPLRRVLVLDSDLPFPEGVAAAEVLRAAHRLDGGEAGGDGGGEGGNLRELAASAAGAGALNLATTGLKLLPDQLTGTFSVGHAVFRLDGGLSLALIGVGYLVRLGACLALLLGVVLAWGVAVPVLTAGMPHVDAATADAVWSDEVRLIGAGIIAVGGLWTVLTLVKPIAGIVKAARQRGDPGDRGAQAREGRDIPLAVVGAAVAVLCLPLAALFAYFAAGGPSAQALFAPVLAVVLLSVVFGFTMAAACGYMAGLLGSSSSPISGIGILSTMLVAIAFLLGAPAGSDAAATRFVTGFTLFITSFIVTVASIANDNLQDLKTGQLVKATPWKQQAVLAVGVVVGAATLAPVLKLLYEAYGFVGSMPHPGMDPRNALPAPQAALMTQIADGIIHHRLPWTMVGIGAGLAIGLVALESRLGRRGVSLPALTVGIGMYLPLHVVVTIALGGVVGWLGERRLARRSDAEAGGVDEAVRRRGVLIASGFLVGESLVGVLVAVTDTLAGRSGSLALGASAASPLVGGIGALVFAACLAAFYRATSRDRFGFGRSRWLRLRAMAHRG